MKRRTLLLAALLVAGAAGAASVDSLRPARLDGRKLRVTTTVGMVADAVRNVGGSRVEVVSLMGPGVDPHLYKASAGDIRRLQGADLVLFSGLHLEGKLVDLLERLPKAVAVTDGLDPAKLIRPEGGFGGQAGLADPHVWFDVSLWKQTVPVVRDALAKVDPAGKNVYAAAAAKYMKELDALDARVRRTLARVPKEQRVLVTAHDAFGYFGRRYGVEVRGLQGISTTAEAGTRDVQALAKFVADRKIRAIFVESSVPRRSVEAVVSASRARGWDLRIGGELFSDAMGADGTREGTYIGMVEHNARLISDALLGPSEARKGD